MSYSNIKTVNWSLTTEPEPLVGLDNERSFVRVRNNSNTTIFIQLVGENDSPPADNEIIVQLYDYILAPGEEVVDYATSNVITYYGATLSGTADPIVRQGY